MRLLGGLSYALFWGRNRSIMAQIHALTPEGRLPSAAQAHVLELTATPTVQPISTGIFGIGDRHIISISPGVYQIGA